MKKAAFWFGIVLVVIGVAGYVPGITTSDNKLIGLFAVDGMHNAIFIVTGIIALLCSADGVAARRGLKTIGVVYALVAIAGLFVGDGQLFSMTQNYWDVALHAVIAIVAASYGWSESSVTLRQAAPAFGEYADRDDDRRR